MKPDAMLTMSFFAFVVAMYGAHKEHRGIVFTWIGIGTVYAILSIWSFTWGQG